MAALAGLHAAAIERWQINSPAEDRMSDHSRLAPVTTSAETPDAFLADRQNFWNGFARFTLWSVIFVIVLLVGMAVFLL
jgi:hypothetical protein